MAVDQKTFKFHTKDEANCAAPPARPTLLILPSLASHHGANAEKKWRAERKRPRERARESDIATAPPAGSGRKGSSQPLSALTEGLESVQIYD